MRVFAYLRVSTDHQVESGAGLAAQESFCKAWAEKNGMAIANVFIEEGVSGAAKLDKRPALLKAIAALGKGDILLVSRLDRLSRDLYGNIIIEEALTRKKAKLISAAGEGTESDDPAYVLLRHMLQAVAGFEKSVIGLRTKAAMQKKKDAGKRVGYIPFGFQLAEGNRIEKCPKEQAILAQIKELRSSGLSIREIATELNYRGIFNRNGNKWNHESVRNALTKIAA
jgi:DNA invertase Pin-like site-specific DNA recombinase